MTEIPLSGNYRFISRFARFDSTKEGTEFFFFFFLRGEKYETRHCLYITQYMNHEGPLGGVYDL